MSTNKDQKALAAFARTVFASGRDGQQTLRNLFASIDDQALADDDGDNAERIAHKQFIAALFADTDQDPVIAGLVAGKTVGRTTPPRTEPVDKGRWYDRTPTVDD